MQKLALATTLALALAGCPSHETPIYHHLNEPGAMETCKGSMPNFDYTATGSSKQDARDKGYAAIRDTVNKRVGATLVHEVLIDQVNFLSKDEIRDNWLRRKKSETASEMTKPFKEH